MKELLCVIRVQGVSPGGKSFDRVSRKVYLVRNSAIISTGMRTAG